MPRGMYQHKRGVYKHSLETRLKIGESNTGLRKGIKNPRHSAWMRLHQPFKGVPKSDEHKRKIGLSNSKALKGRKLPRSVVEKIRRSQVAVKANPLYRAAISRKLRGSRSHLWRGGRTSSNKLIRGSFEYRSWRQAVFARDDWTCLWCGKRGGELNADHIKSFADYPNLRFVINNGRTLCVPCHKRTESYMNRWKRKGEEYAAFEIIGSDGAEST